MLIIFISILLIHNLTTTLQYQKILKTQQQELIKAAKAELSKGVEKKAIIYLESAVKLDLLEVEDAILLLKDIYMVDRQYIKTKNLLESVLGYNNITNKTHLAYIDFLVQRNEINKAIDYLNSLKKDQEIQEKLIEVAYKYYELSIPTKDIMLGKSYYLIQEGFSIKYYDKTGYLNFSLEMQASTPYLAEIAIVLDETRAYMINLNGEVMSASDYKVDEILPFVEERAAIRIHDEYFFIDQSFRKTQKSYQQLGSYSSGYAPFMRDNEWGIRDIKGKEVVYGYSDLIFDKYMRATTGKVVFIKKDNKTKLLSLKEKKYLAVISDAKTFLEESAYAAVKQGEKWGFMNVDGEIVIEPIFCEAKSFSCGLAAICVDGKWGYIETGGRVVIKPIYDYASEFSDGMAIVLSSGKPIMLILKRFQDQANLINY